MRGSVVLAGAILGAVSLVGAPAQAAAPDPYSGSIETDCGVHVPAVVHPGKHVIIKISIGANNPTPPSGNVEITIKTKPGGDLVWDRTVSYHGGTKTVVGPVLDEGQDYAVQQRFKPDDATFARCRAAVTFAVDDARAHNPNDNDDNGPGGLLPDTGGPALLWLLLGVGLVGGGSATVAYSRRRSPATA